MQFDFSCFIRFGNANKFVNMACTYTSSHFIITLDKCNNCDEHHSRSLLFMGILTYASLSKSIEMQVVIRDIILIFRNSNKFEKQQK